MTSDRPIADLVGLAKDGSLPAYAEIVRRLQGRLYNFLLRRTRSAADAEDLAQDAFIRAWQRIGQYDPRYQFTTWLFTIAHRLAAAHYRRNGRMERAGRDRPAGRPPDEPAARIAEAEESRHLWTVAEAELSAQQCTALWLRYAEDLSIREIARVTGRTQTAVRVTLFRARERLAACTASQPAPEERLRPQDAGVPCKGTAGECPC